MNFAILLLSIFTVTSATKVQTSIEDTLTAEGCECIWTKWMNNDDYSPYGGDNNTYTNLRRNHNFCSEPSDIQCRSTLNPTFSWESVKAYSSKCDVTSGLYCESKMMEQDGQERFHVCADYELRVLCCDCPQPTTRAATTPVPTETTPEETTEEVTEILWFDPFTDPSDFNEGPIDEEPIHMFPFLLIIVICIGIVILIVVIFLCRKKCTSESEEDVHQEYYSYSPPKNHVQTLDFYVEHNLSSNSESSCTSSARDYELSDIDDYDVTDGKHSKRRSKSERDRLKNNGNYYNGGESSPLNNGRNSRKWFPDEHQRGLDVRPPVIGRPKQTFMSTFVTNSRRNSPSIEEEFVTV